VTGVSHREYLPESAANFKGMAGLARRDTRAKGVPIESMTAPPYARACFGYEDCSNVVRITEEPL